MATASWLDVRSIFYLYWQGLFPLQVWRLCLLNGSGQGLLYCWRLLTLPPYLSEKIPRKFTVPDFVGRPLLFQQSAGVVAPSSVRFLSPFTLRCRADARGGIVFSRYLEVLSIWGVVIRICVCILLLQFWAADESITYTQVGSILFSLFLPLWFQLSSLSMHINQGNSNSSIRTGSCSFLTALTCWTN